MAMMPNVFNLSYLINNGIQYGFQAYQHKNNKAFEKAHRFQDTVTCVNTCAFFYGFGLLGWTIYGSLNDPFIELAGISLIALSFLTYYAFLPQMDKLLKRKVNLEEWTSSVPPEENLRDIKIKLEYPVSQKIGQCVMIMQVIVSIALAYFTGSYFCILGGLLQILALHNTYQKQCIRFDRKHILHPLLQEGAQAINYTYYFSSLFKSNNSDDCAICREGNPNFSFCAEHVF